MNASTGHVNVEQRDVGAVLLGELDPLLGGCSFGADFTPARLQSRSDPCPQTGVVIGHDDPDVLVEAAYHVTVTTLPFPGDELM